MNSIKDLNEKLIREAKDLEEKDKKDKKEKKQDRGTLKSKEYRDTMQNYVGRISGTAKINVNYKELKKELEDKASWANWSIPHTKKVFEIITKMIGVQPSDTE